MRSLYFYLFISIATLLTACSSADRAPSSTSDADSDYANRIQEIDIKLSQFWNKDWKTDQVAFQKNPDSTEVKPVYDRSLLDRADNRIEVEKLTGERSALVSEFAKKLGLQSWSGNGPWLESSFHHARPPKEEILEFKDFSGYELSHPPLNPFPLEHRFYSGYKLRLLNLFPAPNQDAVDEKEKRKQYFLRARLECNADMTYDDNIIFIHRRTTSKVYEFRWYYNKVNGQNLNVEFSPDVTHCQLRFYDPQKSSTWTHGMEFADLYTQNPEWAKLSSKIDVCARPTGPMKDSVESFFWQQDFNFSTCPQSYDELINLDDRYNSVNQRILGLTGSPLRRQDFDNKNPMAPLDFSKAPHFDIIWVSSLNFSADFYGMVLSRALRYHAERGTQIRVLTAEATMKKKDKAILEALQKGVPNVKLQYYQYHVTDGKDGTFIDRFHRVSHTKLLIGYSAANPKASFLVTGGRNIRDSYIFTEAPIYKAYANLKNYGEGEEPFIYYRDFEVEIRGQDFVKSVLSQMISLWMRDPANQSFRSTNINIPKESDAAEIQRLTGLQKKAPLVRHMLSLPYFDGYQLEKFYVQMIDSARSEIVLTTPYFRPSVAIAGAFDRAAKRGVKIQAITRIHLAGDDVPQIAEDVNKQGINRLLAHVDIYEWTEPKSILHAKLFVVDKKLAFVSSVNLNRRSFLHDIESGVLISHEGTAREIREEVLSFIRQGRKITQQEKISWINGTLIDWADSYF